MSMLLFWLLGCSTTTPEASSPSSTLSVAYQSRLSAELEVCGCPKNPLGGFARRRTVLEIERREYPVVVVDGGDALAAQLYGPTEETALLEQRRVRADAVAEVLADGGLDAMVLGAADWSIGRSVVDEVVRTHNLPVLAANLTCDDAQPFPSHVVVEREGWRVGIVGVTLGSVEGCFVSDPKAALVAAVRELPEVDVTLALWPARDLTAQAAAKSGLPVDLLVDASGRHVGEHPPFEGQTWLLGAGQLGKEVGLARIERREGAVGLWAEGGEDSLRLRRDRLAERQRSASSRAAGATGSAKEKFEAQVAAYQVQIDEIDRVLEGLGELPRNGFATVRVPLNDDIPDHEATAKRVAAAMQRIAVEGTGSRLDPLMMSHEVTRDGSAYAGSDTCKSCHVEEWRQWAGTPHSRAWATLVSKDRHTDEACVSCHVTGVGAEGGSAGLGDVAGFQDVQCEACHGPARAHVTDPATLPTRTPSQQTCVQCHDGVRDQGDFHFETYWPKVTHGK